MPLLLLLPLSSWKKVFEASYVDQQIAAAGAWKSILGAHPLTRPLYPSFLTIVWKTSLIEPLLNLSQPQIPCTTNQWQKKTISISDTGCSYIAVTYLYLNHPGLSNSTKTLGIVGSMQQCLQFIHHLFQILTNSFDRKIVLKKWRWFSSPNPIATHKCSTR